MCSAVVMWVPCGFLSSKVRASSHQTYCIWAHCRPALMRPFPLGLPWALCGRTTLAANLQRAQSPSWELIQKASGHRVGQQDVCPLLSRVPGCGVGGKRRLAGYSQLSISSSLSSAHPEGIGAGPSCRQHLSTFNTITMVFSQSCCNRMDEEDQYAVSGGILLPYMPLQVDGDNVSQ